VGWHLNSRLSESRLTFRCGRCDKTILRSVDEMFDALEEDIQARWDRVEFLKEGSSESS
jgi:hypothetical protein